MKIFKWLVKHLIYTVIFSFFFAIFIFTLNPFSEETAKSIVGILLLISSFFVIIAVIGLVKGNVKVLRLKSRYDSFHLFLITITCFYSSSFLTMTGYAINSATAEVLGTETYSINQKFDVLKTASTNAINDHKTKKRKYTMKTEDYKNISFQYPEDNQELADFLIKNIEHIDSTINAITEVENVSPLRVIIYADKYGYQKATNTSLDDVMKIGVYRKGVIHLMDLNALKGSGYPDEFFNEDMLSIFTHEYFHHVWGDYLVEKNISANKIPVWFEEGLAEYSRYALNDNFPILDFSDVQIPLKNLEKIAQWEEYAKSGVTYGKSFMAIHYLIEEKGTSIVANIINFLAKSESFDETFYKEVGMTIEDFEEEMFDEYKK